MSGGLSPLPRRDGCALREGWSLKSRRLQGDLRLIILWCKSWLMSNQGLGRRGGRGGLRGIPLGKGLLAQPRPGGEQRAALGRQGKIIPSPLSSGTGQRIPGSFPCFTHPLPPRLAVSPLLSNHASYQEPIYLIIWDLELFHVFVVRDNTSHPADSINLSGITRLPKRARTSWIMVKPGREGGSPASLLAHNQPARGSHPQRGLGRVRMEQEDSLHPVPSRHCLPFPTECGTNISR